MFVASFLLPSLHIDLEHLHKMPSATSLKIRCNVTYLLELVKCKLTRSAASSCRMHSGRPGDPSSHTFGASGACLQDLECEIETSMLLYYQYTSSSKENSLEENTRTPVLTSVELLAVEDSHLTLDPDPRRLDAAVAYAVIAAQLTAGKIHSPTATLTNNLVLPKDKKLNMAFKMSPEK